MTTTRARKLEFIESFGDSTLENAALDMIRYRPGFLTDEQIALLTEHVRETERNRLHHKINERNRRRSTSEPVPVFRDRPGMPKEFVRGASFQSASTLHHLAKTGEVNWEVGQ